MILISALEDAINQLPEINKDFIYSLKTVNSRLLKGKPFMVETFKSKHIKPSFYADNDDVKATPPDRMVLRFMLREFVVSNKTIYEWELIA